MEELGKRTLMSRQKGQALFHLFLKVTELPGMTLLPGGFGGRADELEQRRASGRSPDGDGEALPGLPQRAARSMTDQPPEAPLRDGLRCSHYFCVD